MSVDIFYPLHPGISMYILNILLCTNLKELIRRICLTIKSFVIGGDNFPYSCDLNV